MTDKYVRAGSQIQSLSHLNQRTQNTLLNTILAFSLVDGVWYGVWSGTSASSLCRAKPFLTVSLALFICLLVSQYYFIFNLC